MLSAVFTSTDAGVVRRVRAGRKDEFGVLVDRYFGLAHAIAFAHTGNYADAEEIAQESFLRAFASLDSLRDGGRFRSWLSAIARNLSRSRLKSARREAPLEAADEPAIGHDAAAAELHALLWDCIEGLDESSREILVLHYFQQMKLRDAAEALEISTAAATKRLQRAREALGADLLRRLEQSPQGKRPHAQARKATIAAVAGSAAAWEASALAATGIGLGAFGAAAAALAIVGAGAVAFVAAPRFAAEEKSAPVVATAETPPPEETEVPAVAPGEDSETSAAGEPVGPAAPLTSPVGPGTLKVKALRPDGSPAAGLNLRVERIDWEEGEEPPDEAVAGEFQLDEQGEAIVQGLAYGTYVAMVSGDNLLDLARFSLSDSYTEDTMTLPLLPAGPLHGRVTDAAGAPAAGVWVYAYSREAAGETLVPHEQAAAMRLRSDEQGRFTAPYAWPGSYRLYARAKDGRSGVSAFTHTSEEFEITLQQPGGIRGIVTLSGTGAPAAGVVVAMRGELERDGGTATSDAAGQFELAELRPGEYRVAVDDAVMVTAPGGEARVQVVSGETAETAIEAAPGGVLAGRVYDQTTGIGIPGVRLAFRIASTMFEYQETDAAGSYFLGSLAAPAVVMVYDVSVDDGLYFVAPEAEKKSVTVEAGGETELDIPMVPAPLLTGRVTREDGARPGEGTMVYVYQRNIQYSNTTQLDSEGRFKLGMKPGHPVDIWAAAGDRESALVRFESVPAEGIQEIELALDIPKVGRLRGTVSGSDGAPVPGLANTEMFLQRASGEQPFLEDAQLWNGRSFEFTALPAGDYNFMISMANSPSIGKLEPAKVTIPPGDTWSEVDLVVLGGGRRLLGQVIDPAGAPIPEAEVNLMNYGAPYDTQISNRRGRFTLSHPGEEGMRLEVRHPDFSTVTMAIEDGVDDLVVEMSPRLTVSGVVRDAVTRVPVPQFTVDDGESRSFKDPEGRFTLEKFNAGPQGLRVNAAGYVETVMPSPAPVGQTVPELEVLMQPGIAFRGLVTDADGVPVPNASVFSGNDHIDKYTLPTTTTDAEGRFTLEDLRSGPIEIGITHSSHAMLLETVTPAPGNAEHHLVMVAGGSVDATIELIDPTGDWTLSIHVLESNSFRNLENMTTTELNGRRVYRGVLHGLSKHATTIEVPIGSKTFPDAYFANSFPLVVEPGKTTAFSRSITVPSASLEVFVTMGGVPSDDSHVNYFQEGGEGRFSTMAIAREPGRYEFPALPDGEGMVRITASSSGDVAPELRAVQLQAGQTGRLEVDLGGAVLELQDCPICSAFFVKEEAYAEVLAAVRESLVQGVFNGWQDQDIFFRFIHDDSRTVRLSPGVYRAGYVSPAADPTEGAQYLLDALEGATLVTLSPGDNGVLALP
jgi:RNA polymerase sigma-70 factor (ECF subfamily)